MFTINFVLTKDLFVSRVYKHLLKIHTVLFEFLQ